MEDGNRNGFNSDPRLAVDDPYELLGVPRGASLLDVKRGYREKVKACHPDLGNEPGRVEEFKRLTRAYKTLSDLLHAAPNAAADPHSGGAGAMGSPGVPTPAAAASAARAKRVDTAYTAEQAALWDLVSAGRARLRTGDYAAAETMARAALARSRECAPAYVLMGEALAARELFAESIGCFTLALQIAPDNAEARALLQKLRDRQKSGQGAAR